MPDFVHSDTHLVAFMTCDDTDLLETYLPHLKEKYAFSFSFVLKGKNRVEASELSVLALAALKGAISHVRFLLKRACTPNELLDALKYAIMKNFPAIADLLIEAIDDEMRIAQEDECLLKIAIRHGQLAMIQRLLKISSMKRKFCQNVQVFFECAVECGRTEVFYHLLFECPAGSGPQANQMTYMALLYQAINEKQIAIVNLLLSIEGSIELSELIKTYPKVGPKYYYLQSGAHIETKRVKSYLKGGRIHLDDIVKTGINPAYFDIETCPLIPVGEKRIFAFRSDGIIAIGIKNDYAKAGNTSLYKKLHKNALMSYPELMLARRDHSQSFAVRYGHDSLMLPERHYNGTAYYAGWLYQRTYYLEVSSWTGRYFNEGLSASQTVVLEIYLAQQLIEAFGQQMILFYDCDTQNDLWHFLAGDCAEMLYTRRGYVWSNEQVTQLTDDEIKQELDKYQQEKALLRRIREAAIDPVNESPKPLLVPPPPDPSSTCSPNSTVTPRNNDLYTPQFFGLKNQSGPSTAFNQERFSPYRRF